MKNKSKWKKFKSTINLNGQEIPVMKYRCLSGCGCVTTKEPDRTKTCPGCDVNNSRMREASQASTAKVKGGIPKRKGGNFKEVDTEGGTAFSPPDSIKTM